MQLHPEIAALRSDGAPQRLRQVAIHRALADWRALEDVQEIERGLADYAAGSRLAECGALAGLLCALPAAQRFVRGWQAVLLDILKAEPLSEVPLRYRCSAGFASFQIMQGGTAALSVIAYERRADVAQPTSALFADRECHEIVLAGAANGQFQRLCQNGEVGCSVDTICQTWRAGDQIMLKPRTEARQFISVEGALLVLQLTRSPIRPAPLKEYRLSDGALVRSASGDKSASQRLMALTVLGAMNRSSALPTVRSTALKCDEDQDVRWEALRQCLTLDAASGIETLSLVARDLTDPLSEPAAKLHLHLLASYAQLRNVTMEAA